MTNEDVTIANLVTPDPAPAAPVAVPPATQPGHGETQPFRVSGAVPGHAESAPSFADGTILPEDDDEMSFFLGDTKKKEASGKEDKAGVPPGTPDPNVPPAPVVPHPAAGTPAAQTASAAPPPAAPPAASAGVSIDPNLLGIAEQFGMTQDEARSYGDPAHLIRTLNIMARQRASTAPALGAPGAAQQPAAPAPEPELVFPDAAEMEAAGYDPNIIRMAQSMKAMHATLKAKVEQYDKILPGLVQGEQQRAAQARNQAVAESFKEAGFDSSAYDAPTLNKIVARVSALYQTYQREGIAPPVSDIIKTVIPLVVPGAQPTAPTNGQAVGANSGAAAAAAQRTALAAARAKLMDRNGSGQFVGLPTHRKGGEQVKGGSLRQTMIDKGYDPGEAPAQDDQEKQGFLPG